MNKFWGKIIFFIVLILVIAVAILEYGQYFEEVIPIQTVRVKFGSLEEIVEMAGYVDSENTETVNSNAEGIIASLKIQEGDGIRWGERLCVIRSPELRAKLLGMKAELLNAMQNLREALTGSEREMAQARYNFIKANIADLEETMKPRSHVEGDVIKVKVQNGSNVAPGMTMFFLADMEEAVIKARMDEGDVPRVKEGQPIWITGDFLSGKSLQGKVYKISKFVDKEVGTYVETTCKIFNPRNLPIKFGAYADVKVITARKKNVLVIPIEAFLMEGGEHVFMIKEERANSTPIKVGAIGEKYVEVLSGLKAGDRIATIGCLDLTDGDKVKYEK